MNSKPISCLLICKNKHVHKVTASNLDEFADLSDSPLKCPEAGCNELAKLYLEPKLAGRQFASVEELVAAQCSPTVQNRFKGLMQKHPI